MKMSVLALVGVLALVHAVAADDSFTSSRSIFCPRPSYSNLAASPACVFSSSRCETCPDQCIINEELAATYLDAFESGPAFEKAVICTAASIFTSLAATARLFGASRQKTDRNLMDDDGSLAKNGRGGRSRTARILDNLHTAAMHAAASNSADSSSAITSVPVRALLDDGVLDVFSCPSDDDIDLLFSVDDSDNLDVDMFVSAADAKAYIAANCTSAVVTAEEFAAFDLDDYELFDAAASVSVCVDKEKRALELIRLTDACFAEAVASIEDGESCYESGSVAVLFQTDCHVRAAAAAGIPTASVQQLKKSMQDIAANCAARSEATCESMEADADIVSFVASLDSALQASEDAAVTKSSAPALSAAVSLMLAGLAAAYLA